VGSFGAGMQGLRNAKLVDAIAQRIDEQQPLLAVCLGLQLLCSQSEESAEVAGLGLFEQTVTRFGPNLRVPQLGWNRVRPSKDCDLLRDGYAYYANSFRLTTIPKGWRGAYSEYGEPFVAAIERGPLLACQFHPELSGAWGQSLIERWLYSSMEVSSC
jgi:imidazole glycerol phosphate synthase glutamine amidotransferase subunit